MQTIFKIAIFALLCIGTSLAVNGVDVSQGLNKSNCSCLKNNGYQFIIARGYRSYGELDPAAKTTLTDCKSEGLITDAYHFPCLGKVSAASQAKTTYNALHGVVGTFWMDVESNPSSGCGWKDHTTNCNFLKDLVSEYKKLGAKVGIYASSSQWSSIFGSTTACSNFSNLPLWYAHYDGTKSFSDFKSFGGWKKPDIKQYKGSTTVCSVGVDLNWYPNSEQSYVKSFLPINE